MFKYTSYTAYALTNIANCEIFLNDVRSFNDPFECRCEVLSGFPEADIESPRFRNVLRAWGFDDAHASDALENYIDYVSSLEGNEADVEHLVNRARISCFSKRSDNLLMWSHYGDGLRGFCIEFDSKKLLSINPDSGRIFEVLYESSPATIDTAVLAVLHDQADFHETAIHEEKNAEWRSEYGTWLSQVYRETDHIYQKMLATKDLAWRYEEELRLICSSTTSKLGETFKYPTDAVRSIIVGERMPDRHLQTIRSLLRNRCTSAQLMQARLVPGSFNLEVVRLEVE